MAKMEAILKYSVKDTKAGGDRTKYAAVIRAILDSTPEGVKGFVTCALRYTLTLENGVVTGCSENLSHTEKTEGYEDDDWLANTNWPRLGGTGTQGSPQEKETFETLLKPWFEFVVLGLRRSEDKPRFSDLRGQFDVVRKDRDPDRPKEFAGLNKALTDLVPKDLLKAQRELSMKVDVYTDRTVYGWHKDWNDGHALVVGLLNVSKHALSSAELVFIPRDTSEDNLINTSKIRRSSTTRTAMRILVPQCQPTKNFVEREDQPSGEILWFNDVVWVHRTPPMGNFGHRDAHSRTFSIRANDVDLPPSVAGPRRAGNAALYANADVGARMLLRVTIRDMYEPCPEVRYERAVDKNKRRMWLRNEGLTPRKWRYKKRPDAPWINLEISTHTVVVDPRTNKPWCLQFLNPTWFDQHWINHPNDTFVVFEFEYLDGTWKPVPPVSVPK